MKFLEHCGAEAYSLNRFSTRLRFPLPDSYPRRLFPGADPERGIELIAALSTTSRIGSSLKELQAVTARAVGVDERETLTNGLGEIRELYEKEWMSDSDSGDE